MTSPEDGCFRGPGPLTIDGMRSAIERAGARVDCYANWIGRGQAMGAAFLQERTPRPVAEGKLSGAVRIVPAGSEATDARGLWLLGHDRLPASYVQVEHTSATDFDLLSAVVRGLGTLRGTAARTGETASSPPS